MSESKSPSTARFLGKKLGFFPFMIIFTTILVSMYGTGYQSFLLIFAINWIAFIIVYIGKIGEDFGTYSGYSLLWAGLALAISVVLSNFVFNDPMFLVTIDVAIVILLAILLIRKQTKKKKTMVLSK